MLIFQEIRPTLITRTGIISAGIALLPADIAAAFFVVCVAHAHEYVDV
jgi:hypothetical protein